MQNDKADHTARKEQPPYPDSDSDQQPRKDGKRTYQKPLKIRGSFDDALRVIVGKQPRAAK